MGILAGTGPALAAACGFSLGLCALLVATRDWHGRYSLDGTGGIQKFHTRPTPRVGGLAIGLAYWLLWPLVPAALRDIWVLIGLAGAPALIAGLAEDLTKRVGVRLRLGATMVAGLLFALLTSQAITGVDLPGVDWLLAFPLAALAFTAFSMAGVANAINIIDGFNGLAAGALLIMFGAFAYVAREVGDPLVFHLALLFAALVLGFFVLNFPFGAIFLGDGGAYYCGYLLAVLGVLLPARNAEVSAWAALLICAYPVIETLASMRRKSRRTGHSIGRPDRVHFHMLAHRRFGRRLVPRPAKAPLRNPATSLVTWSMPALSAVFAALGHGSAAWSAAGFFAMVFVYGQIYRLMSLNAHGLSAQLARLL